MYDVEKLKKTDDKGVRRKSLHQVFDHEKLGIEKKERHMQRCKLLVLSSVYILYLIVVIFVIFFITEY